MAFNLRILDFGQNGFSIKINKQHSNVYIYIHIHIHTYITYFFSKPHSYMKIKSYLPVSCRSQINLIVSIDRWMPLCITLSNHDINGCIINFLEVKAHNQFKLI